MEFLLITLILFTFFFHLSAPVLPSERIHDVAEVLSNSGYLEMSTTLQLVSQTLISQSSPITVFAPCDEVFKRAGQPHLNFLQYHIIPAKLSLDVLRSLSFGTEIPTLFENHTLIVTSKSTDGDISLNNVTISGSAIFNDGNIVVYGINKFFDINFAKSTLNVRNSSKNLERVATQFANYSEIVLNLLHTHYSSIGGFLDMQSLGFGDKTELTIFVPAKNLSGFHHENVFRRHAVPIRLTRQDLVNIEGAVIPTLLKGFYLKLSKSGDVVALNGVSVFFPEVYSGKQVVIYCIEELLELNDQQGLEGDSFSGCHINNTKTVVDHSCVGGCHINNTKTVVDHVCGGALYCNKRTTLFIFAQVLVIGFGIGLYHVYKNHEQFLLIGSYYESVDVFFRQNFFSKYTLTWLMTMFEIISFFPEVLVDPMEGHTVVAQAITISITFVSVYLTFSLYHYHGPSLLYKLFDLGLLLITSELMIYFRISDFLGEPVPRIMDIIAPWAFLASMYFHFVETLRFWIRHHADEGRGSLFFLSIGVVGFSAIHATGLAYWMILLRIGKLL